LASLVQSTQVLNTKLVEKDEETKKLRAQLKEKQQSESAMSEQQQRCTQLEQELAWLQT
jgi:bifunctional ADP-heptose synthase (sugar kinase/adenylyltransferase)